MRLVRSWTLMAVLVACLVGTAAGDEGPSIAGGTAGSNPPAGGGARDVPCSPVTTVWPVSSAGRPRSRRRRSWRSPTSA
jgi:hypothetical protein